MNQASLACSFVTQPRFPAHIAALGLGVAGVFASMAICDSAKAEGESAPDAITNIKMPITREALGTQVQLVGMGTRTVTFMNIAVFVHVISLLCDTQVHSGRVC